MRKIVIDAETIGLDPLDGHRIVEIGGVELINRSPTGQTFHRYVCPQRAMPADPCSARLVGDGVRFTGQDYHRDLRPCGEQSSPP
jgi:Exonuclease